MLACEPQSYSPVEQSFLPSAAATREASRSLCGRRLPDPSPSLPDVRGHQRAREWTRPPHKVKLETLPTWTIMKELFTRHGKGLRCGDCSTQSLDTGTSEDYVLSLSSCWGLE